MHPNTQKERFSLAYIAAVAAKAGFDLVEPPVDTDSIDGALISLWPAATHRVSGKGDLARTAQR